MRKLLVLIMLLQLSMEANCYPQDAEQMRVLIKARSYGARVGMKYSMMAIVSKESSYGKHRANWVSGCYGIGGIRLGTYMDLHHISRTYENTTRCKNELAWNDVVNLKAIEENLRWWLNYHNGSWKKAWGSYYAGTNWRKGIEYANDIKRRIKALKRRGY